MLQNYKENMYFDAVDTSNGQNPDVRLNLKQVATIETTYLGNNPKLTSAREGKCYFDIKEDSWLFQSNMDKDFYRVPFYLLSVNLEKDFEGKYYTEAKYVGLNKEISGKIGKLFVETNTFRLNGDYEVYRVNLSSIVF